MGLKVIIQKDKVNIPKINAEFSLALPAKEISEPALQVLAYLKNSPYIQIKINPSYESKIFEILRDYGRALFEAILPKNYREQLQESANFDSKLDLYIDFLPWIEIAWELVHNGINWHALDAGVRRIYLGKARTRYYAANSKNSWHFAHNTLVYQGLQTQSSLEFFQTPIKWLQKKHKNLLSRFTWEIYSQTKEQQLKEVFVRAPRYLYLEGFYNLDKLCVSSFDYKIVDKSLEELGFAKNVEQGLELLLCNLKQICITPNSSYNALLHKCFELGLPRLIDFTGSMHKGTMAIYMTRLMFAIAQDKQIDQAHLQAIQNIAKADSWDWIWVRFWENDKKLAAVQAALNKDTKHYTKDNALFFLAQPSWSLRLFRGDLLQLENLEQKILALPLGESLFILDDNFQDARSYLNQIAIKHYKDIRTIDIVFLADNSAAEQKAPNNFDIFSADIKAYLQQNNQKTGIYLQHYKLAFSQCPQKTIIQVFFPFNHQNLATQIKEFKTQFLACTNCLQEKFSNYVFVFVCYQKVEKEHHFLLESPSFESCVRFFDSASQETIRSDFAKIILQQNISFSYRLLKILFLLKIKNFAKDNLYNIWEIALSNLKQQLSSSQQKILGICFCLHIAIPVDFLINLFKTKKILGDVEKLYSYNLVEKNATHVAIYLEAGVQHLLAKMEFFSTQELQKLNFSLLHFFCELSTNSYRRAFISFIRFGFADCIFLEKGKYLKRIYNLASNSQAKQLVYTKIFEQLHHLPEKEVLFWLGAFCIDTLKDSKDLIWVKKIQDLNDILEEKEEWNLFCKNHLELCRFFLQQGNRQRVKNFLAPVIELSKNRIFSFYQITQIAFLLIELGDDNIYLSLLDYFPIILGVINKKDTSDKMILKAYQYFLQGKKQNFFDLLCFEVNNAKKLNIAFYSKVYMFYIRFCGEQKKIQDLKIFTLKFKETLGDFVPYNNYKIIINALFDVISANKQDYQNKLLRDFFALLEPFYKFAEMNQDKDIVIYADILGKFYFDIGCKKESNFYYDKRFLD